MKTNAIIRIMIWSLVLLVLAGLLTGGLTLDSYRSRESSAVESSAVPLPFPAGKITELEIDWVAGDIAICPSDVTEITITESGAEQERDAMQVSVRDRRLIIEYSKRKFSVGFGRMPSKDLYIYVPQDWVCQELSIDSADADISLQDLTIGAFDLDGADGNCEFINCQAGSLDIDTADGDIQFSGTLDTLDFDAASASFTAQLHNTPSRMDMDSMSGSLDIALPEDCGYAISMDGLSRSFQSEFDNASVYGDGRCRINVDGLDCDVTIRKAVSPAS